MWIVWISHQQKFLSFHEKWTNFLIFHRNTRNVHGICKHYWEYFFSVTKATLQSQMSVCPSVSLSLCLSLDLSDNHLKDPWIFLISLISNVLDLSYLRSIRCLIRYQYPSASLSLCLTTIMPISFLIFLRDF